MYITVYWGDFFGKTLIAIIFAEHLISELQTFTRLCIPFFYGQSLLLASSAFFSFIQKLDFRRC